MIDGEAWEYLAQEDGLELEHPCDGEQNSGIIGDERSAGKKLVTAGSIKMKKSLTYGIPTHPIRIHCDLLLLLVLVKRNALCLGKQ